MTERQTYLTGEWVPESKASVHIYDSQFMFGDAVFEMARTFNHKFFLLDDHIDRLFKSMKYLEIPINKTKKEVRELCEESLQRNMSFFDKKFGDFPEECRLMINVSRGPLGIYREVFELQKGEKWNEPTWIINVWELSKTAKTLAHYFDTGVNAVITEQRQVPSRLIENKVKNRSRLHYQVANLQVKNSGKDAMALLLDEDGFVTEGTGANFLIIKNGKIVSPELRNMLRGTSMTYITEVIAPQLGIEVVYKNFEAYDVLDADEAMFTGTFVNLLPCNRLNGKYLNDKVKEDPMGDITKMIFKQWSDNVGIDVSGQVKAWSK